MTVDIYFLADSHKFKLVSEFGDHNSNSCTVSLKENLVYRDKFESVYKKTQSNLENFPMRLNANFFISNEFIKQSRC